MKNGASRGVMAGAAVASPLLLLLTAFGVAASVAVATDVAGSNCTKSCGNISIPYPFGVEPGCYYAAGFNLTCKYHSHRPPELFLGDGTIPVLDISVTDGRVRINISRLEWRFEFDGRNTTMNGTWGGLPQGGPYFLSESAINRLVVVGCGVRVDLRGGDDDGLLSSCTPVCPRGHVTPGEYGRSHIKRVLVKDRRSSNCSGIGCCGTNIALGYSFYHLQGSLHPEQKFLLPVSVYITDGVFNYNVKDVLKGRRRPEALPAMLDWVINNSRCPTNASAPECRSANSFCRNSFSETNLRHRGYVCSCSDGYHGNPYTPDGCQDIDECKNSRYIYPCYGKCKNTKGSYLCKCASGYKGNASVPNGCKDINECKNPQKYSCFGECTNLQGTFQCQCPNGTYGNPFTNGGCNITKNSLKGLIIGLGVGGGISLFLVALGVPIITREIKLRNMKRLRAKYFNQNHGLLLQQLVSQNADIGGRMITPLRELEKATNHFDSARVIGGGGHGVVFKGIIDLNVVAIKKSKIVVQREIEEFINEVAILSQVNHRNVVKLLGCCLETEVPLLVYEFIANGTLYQHLHVEGQAPLPWVDRIRIALEVVRALSYLHSATMVPILHRDIKSSNILIDDSLTAKVSDFGASRYIPIDQTGVTTNVQGTRGYLDPMYYYTSRLTNKSDVFSFGVLLIELLTRKKPYVYRSTDGDGRVSHFVSLLTEGKLVEIIDPQVMEDEDGEVQEVAAIAVMCTKLRREDRPTMREVEMALEKLLVDKKQLPCVRTPRRYDEEQTPIHYMSTGRVIDQASRQYTMEEEIWLSASLPR